MVEVQHGHSKRIIEYHAALDDFGEESRCPKGFMLLAWNWDVAVIRIHHDESLVSPDDLQLELHSEELQNSLHKMIGLNGFTYRSSLIDLVNANQIESEEKRHPN